MTEEAFLKDIDSWCSHRKLLFAALENTSGNVLEMGMGDGSTPYLHSYCEDAKRLLVSLDNNEEWCVKFKHLDSPYHIIECVDYDVVKFDDYKFSVVLIDHAPGERRAQDIMRLKDKSEIIVIHDSQPEATGYGLVKIWHHFKYRCDFKHYGDWATAVSNTIDITNLIKTND